MSDPRIKVDQVVRALKGLAEPTRLRLLALLGAGELTVGEVCRVVGQSQPRVSRHLRLLTETGFLDRFREQQCVYYRTPATGPRSAWVKALLAAIDPDDAALRRDRVRRAVVIGDRGLVAVDVEGVGLATLLCTELQLEAAGVLPPAARSLGALLDIGTGAGRMLEMLGAHATHAIGIDLSTPALRLARARVHGRGFAHCEFHRGDMYALSFDAQTFDTTTIDRVLAGAERPIDVLLESARTLRSAGRLLVVERWDDMAGCAGGDPSAPRSPLDTLQHWIEQSGLRATRLTTFDLASGRHLLAVAQPAPECTKAQSRETGVNTIGNAVSDAA